MLLSAAGCSGTSGTIGTDGTGTDAATVPETVNPEDEEEPTGAMQGFLCVAGPLEFQPRATVKSTEDALSVAQEYLKTHGYRNAWQSLTVQPAVTVGNVTYYRA